MPQTSYFLRCNSLLSLHILSLALQGWEERRTTTGRLYYVNHHDRTTTWERPTLPAHISYVFPPHYHSGLPNNLNTWLFAWCLCETFKTQLFSGKLCSIKAFRITLDPHSLSPRELKLWLMHTT